MANFMGQRLGTVNGHPYLANRVKTPLYPSVVALPETTHLRFLIQSRVGQFWSPYVRHRRLISTVPKHGIVVELECDPLLSDHTFTVDNVSVVDLLNHVISRPYNYSLPYEVLRGEHVFKWQVLCSRL